MSENNNLTGIILSGGKSSRMGKDKGFCELENKPLVAYSIDILAPISSQIIIGANDDIYNNLGFGVIKDEIKNIGPIGGIYSCLKSSQTADNIIISCDMPLIPSELIEYILSAKAGYDVVIPIFRGFPEPLCAYYNKSIVPNLLVTIETKNYKLQDVLRNFKTNFLQINAQLSFYHENLFANINSPQDLQEIKNHLSNKG